MGLDVGIYFFSYANSNSLAKKDALWVLDQIKDYKVTLPIAFDWEDFQNFNDYNLSFFGLTDMANTFLDTITEHGYEGMIYGSKSYLEKIWLPTNYDTWLAHYTKQTNYEKEYKFWQICDDGQIDGIDGAVDIDIMYVD
jgi:GH25 family lysozyme M1 (1,4-beta-N-acetylmuramidase)